MDSCGLREGRRRAGMREFPNHLHNHNPTRDWEESRNLFKYVYNSAHSKAEAYTQAKAALYKSFPGRASWKAKMVAARHVISNGMR